MSEVAAIGTIVAVVGIIAIAITQMVFATIGMSHAVPNLQNPPEFNSTTCHTVSEFEPNMMYIWLVVEGALVWVSIIVSILTPSSNEEGEYQPNPLGGLVQLGSLGWIIYGCVIIFNETIYNSLVSCDDWGAYLMYTMSTLFIVCYGVLGALMLFTCCVVCGSAN